MRVIYVPIGGKSPNYPAEPGRHGLVEFYDLRHMHTPDGQFISRYTLDTYMEDYDNSLGLDLMGYEPDWKINANTRMIIGDWIKYLTKETTHA
jgi:hypothetical protein